MAIIAYTDIKQTNNKYIIISTTEDTIKQNYKINKYYGGQEVPHHQEAHNKLIGGFKRGFP